MTNGYKGCWGVYIGPLEIASIEIKLYEDEDGFLTKNSLENQFTDATRLKAKDFRSAQTEAIRMAVIRADAIKEALNDRLYSDDFEVL